MIKNFQLKDDLDQEKVEAITNAWSLSENKVFHLKSNISSDQVRSFYESVGKKIGKLHYLANFSLRCGSLFEAINEVSPNINILNAAINLQRGASITGIMIKKNNPDQIDQEIQNNIIEVTNTYRNLIKINKDTNGEFIEGSNLLVGDQEICKKFVPRAYRFLGNNGFKLKK